MRIVSVVAGLVVLFAFVASPTRAQDNPDDLFEKRIRPVLAEHCWKCHGPTKQSSGLRLDSRDAILQGGSGEGAAVVAGDPEASPMIRAVRQHGELKMPPKGHLPDDAIADLTSWVKAGAPWPVNPGATSASADLAKTHWSFQPMRLPTPPEPSVSPIDAFLNAKIKSAGLTPSGRANRRTLIRRSSFDLIGLPPSPADVDAFLADSDPDAKAFAKVVDRMLASPQYGERWGRYWLDVARYADSKGYVFTEETRYPFSYTYRDWVVTAFNEDLPYDQFVLEQIAADRLPQPADNRHLAALGFLTVGRRFLQDQNEIIDDRIDVVTRGLLGLSVSCARCHNHKFDPIPTEDYYSLYGVFASSEEPKDLPVLSLAGSETGSSEYQTERAERRKAIDAFLADKLSAAEKDLREHVAAYLIAAQELKFEPRAQKLDEVAKVASLRPELVRRFMMRWRVRTEAGDRHLTLWKKLSALTTDDFADQAKKLLADANSESSDSRLPRALLDALAAEPPDSPASLAKQYGDILAKALAEPADGPLKELRDWLESADGPIKIAPDELRRALTKPDRDRIKELEKKVAELDITHPGAPPRAMVMVDKTQPVEPHVFLRGNPGRQGPQVPRRFLRVVSTSDRPPFKDGSGRLELARAIVRPDNPLTARVMVNRIWMYHFGQGLVHTPSDFGSRGDAPTHPELLDWLASTFVANGWSIKAMHRLIMASDAYQRASVASPEAIAKDPQNNWLSHQNRRRLDYESMRDSLLAASGRLDSRVGGRPVKLETEPFSTRRTLYGLIDRYNLEPVYRTFDFPNPDSSSPRRSATIVPQQALYLMNSPFAAQQARHLAARIDAAGGSPEERIRGIYRLLFSREPDASELQTGLAFKARQSAVSREERRPPWKYGIGRIDDSQGLAFVADFRRFPHWSGQAWQLEPSLPTPDGNYANVRATGGHPGPDPTHGVIVRWTAPTDLVVTIGGRLAHDEKQGDGVRARVVSSRDGIIGTWTAKGSRVRTVVDRVELRRGDVLDFVVDCVTEHSFDSYSWAPTIRVVGSAPAARERTAWDAKAEFQGPAPKPLKPAEAYAQALLLTNEFLYID
jgi:mono/diheme cytochrome c family protein